jgi:membrane protein implicated in regulation of membrane protease activity
MTMDSFYLVCFGVGLVLSVASVLGGFTHLHLGRLHIGHATHTPHSAGVRGNSHGLSSVNGFTVTAFLCWFGGAGYLLHSFSVFVAPLVLLLSLLSGIAGAALLWAVLFKVLLPRERVLTAEDTEMTGVLAQVSDSIRDGGGIGEILFSQTGARRCSAARSEDGRSIQRGTEVVVIRYERGVAYVRRWDDFNTDPVDSVLEDQ